MDSQTFARLVEYGTVHGIQEPTETLVVERSTTLYKNGLR